MVVTKTGKAVPKATAAKKATTKRTTASTKSRVNLMLTTEEQRALHAIAPGAPINADLLHAVLEEAMPLILARRDANDYAAAYQEWTGGEDAEAWETTSRDGLDV